MKRFFPFGPMLRDGPDYDTPALNEARNVIPVHGVYRPIRRVRTISQVESGSGLTPWIHFDGGATSRVDFAANPIANSVATVILRFRTDVTQDALIAGAGLARLVGGTNDIGWAIGTETSAGFVRMAYALGTVLNQGTPIRFRRAFLPGGYSSGAWHVLVGRLNVIFDEQTQDFASQMDVIIDGIQSPVYQETYDVGSATWNSLPMIWGRGTDGSQRFIGDVERVITREFHLSWEEAKELADSTFDGVMPGGYKAGHLWTLREGTGSIAADYAAVSPLDGTLGAGVTWEGDLFELTSSSGITGGIAHFYTAIQESIGRGLEADIEKGDFRTFGRTHPDHPEDFFRQLWSKEPDDSRGILHQIRVDPGDTSTSGETTYIGRLKSFPDPGTPTGHVVQYRYIFNGTPENAVAMRLRVYLDDGEDEIALLGDHETTDPDGVWHHESVTVSGAGIGDYSNLRPRFVSEIVGAERQSALPSGDLQNPDDWKNEDSETVDLWESIDDPFEPSDPTFAESPGIAPGGTSKYRFNLSEVEDPQHGNGFNVVCQVSTDTEGMDCVVRLLEDGVQRARRTFTDIPTTPTIKSFQPSVENMEGIQDFSALQMEVTFKAHEDPGEGGTGGLTPTAFDGPVVNTTGPVSNLVEEDGLTVNTGAGGDGGRFRVALLAGEDPGTDQNHRIRIVGNRTGANASVSVQLYSGGAQIYDSRNFGEPILLPTTIGSELTWDLPTSVVAQIASYQSLRIQVLTHTSASGGTAHYDYLALEYPGAGTGGRKGKLFWAILGLPSDTWVGVSWVRMFVPDPNSAEKSDVTELYAGDYKQIYRVDDSPWSIVSKPGGYSFGTIPRSWVFVPFGANVIATNKVDPVQVKAPGDDEFSDLITSTAKPQFATICVVQRHLIGANISYVGIGPDGQPDEWWCAAHDDPADFDISVTTGANRGRILSAPGEILGSVGGDFATLFKQKSVHRLDWVGIGGNSPTFRESVVSSSHGTLFPRGIVQVGRDVYFLDSDGFKVVRAGQQVIPVGEGAVNRMVTDSAYERRAVQPVDTDEIPIAESVCVGAYDRITGCIWWSLRTVGIQTDEPAPIWRNNVILIYNPKEDRWAVVELQGATTDPSDDPIAVTHLYSLPPAKEASDSLARGIGVISVKGNFPSDYSLMFQRFLGQKTYPALFETKIWSSKMIASDIREVLINALRPSYRMAPESVSRPIVEARILSADDPFMQFDVNQEDADLSQASPDMWYPMASQGEFFIFRLLFPPLTNQTIREVNGIEIDFQDAGEL